MDSIEMRLKALSPAPLSDSLMNRLCSAIDEASANPLKIVRFPKEPAKKTPFFPFSSKTAKWSWAAAIALLGAATALLMTGNNGEAQRLASSGDARPETPRLLDNTRQDTNASQNLASGLVSYDDEYAVYPEASSSPADQKTLWLNNESPHLYLKVNAKKTLKGKDKNGNPVEVTVPESRYLLVPVEAY